MKQSESNITDAEILAMQSQDNEIISKMKGAFIDCENPNDMLYRFEGTLGLPGGNLVPLGPD